MPIAKNYLPDVNGWLAAAVRRHIHHSEAKAWFDTTRGTFAFCRVTLMGFLRLFTNLKVMGVDVLSAFDAWKVYRKFLADPRIAFANEPTNLEKRWTKITDSARFNQNLWADAYLAAFANAGGHAEATFAKDFRRLPGGDIPLCKSSTKKET